MESDDTARSEDDLGGNCYLAFENGVRAYVFLLYERFDNRLYDEADVMGNEGRINIPRHGRDFEWWRKAEGMENPEGTGLPYQVNKNVIDQLMYLCPFPSPQSTASRSVHTVQDLIQCVKTGKEPNNSGDEGLHDLEVAIALRESHRQGGRRIDLPIADRSLKIISSEDIRFPDLPRAMVGNVPIQQRQS